MNTLSTAYLMSHFLTFLLVVYDFVNGSGVVCDQKTSKFFASQLKEPISGHVGEMEFIQS
jgi:hypothetical protein